MTAPSLDFDDFDALRRLIYDYSGIWLGDNKLVFLQGHLGDRLRARNISLSREYYYFLKYDSLGAEEIQALTDAITINETWFFRETESIEAWRDAVAPDLLKRDLRLRLWSATCSTGEEPYTLAMLLLEAFPESATAQFEILATDISQRALEVARAGVYDLHSLRHTAPDRLDKYFQPQPGGRRRVAEKVRQLVRFGWTNLLDPALAARVGTMDVIFCRNTLIYFDDQSRRAVLDNLYSVLKPGGHLALGLSETLAHAMLPFELARVNKTIMYRKPAKE